MLHSRESSRLAWLAAAVSEQRERIVSLLRRMTGMGPEAAMPPAVFRKFLSVLDQVAVARDKEVEAISEIEAIERKHKMMRATHRLERATASAPRTDPDVDDGHHRDEQPKHRLFWLLAFCSLFSSKPINEKKQSLTAD